MQNPFNTSKDNENDGTYDYKELNKCFGKEGEITFYYSTKDLIIHARQQHWEVVDKILAKPDESININATDEFGHSLIFYALKFEQFAIVQAIRDKTIWHQEQMEELISFSVSENKLDIIRYMLTVYISVLKKKSEDDIGNPARITAISFMLTQSYLQSKPEITKLLEKNMHTNEMSLPTITAIISKTLKALIIKGADDQLKVVVNGMSSSLNHLFQARLVEVALDEQQHGDSGRCLNVLKILLNKIPSQDILLETLKEDFKNRFPTATQHQKELENFITSLKSKKPEQVVRDTNCCVM